MDEDLLGRARDLILDPDRLVRARATGHAPGHQPRWRKVDLRPVTLRSGPRLQVVGYTDTQAFTSNHDWNDPATAVAVGTLLDDGYSEWVIDARDERVRVRRGKGGRVTGSTRMHEQVREPNTSHDRTKDRLLPLDHPVLAAVGLTTSDGQARSSKSDKLRQVDEFLRLLGPAVSDAGLADLGRPLRMVDLGCGNAYLTFAAHAFLVNQGTAARVVGVDVRESARRHNATVAERLGVASDVTFVAATIDAGMPLIDDSPPDVVLALHACDTASDDALAAGVRSGARLLLVAPCCHHDLQRQLSSAAVPYPALTRHGILRERLGDVLTDAVRADLLRLLGFRVDVVEFIGSQHTPRNVLLRATHTGAPAPAERWHEFDRLVDDWGIRPRLADVLADEVAAARPEALS